MLDLANTTITVGIPSRNRVDQLRRCINSIAATCGMRFRICVGFGDDEAGMKYLPPYPFVARTNFVPRGWYVHDTNRTFQFMRKVCEDNDDPLDYFVITQDDSEFVRPGWGSALIDFLHKRFPDGMGAVEFFNNFGFSNFISRAAVFDEFEGKILPDQYKHYFADSHRRQQLLDRDRFYGLEYNNPLDMVCRHPTFATVDPLGIEARETWFEHDKEIFKRSGFAG